MLTGAWKPTTRSDLTVLFTGLWLDQAVTRLERLVTRQTWLMRIRKRRQKSSKGDFTFVQGAWLSKIWQKQRLLNGISYFNLGTWTFIWRKSPTNAPHSNGTGHITGGSSVVTFNQVENVIFYGLALTRTESKAYLYSIGCTACKQTY